MTVASLRRARTFTSIRKHRNYRLYFTGQVISVTGTWMQNVAQAWLVVQLTHSPLAVGMLAVCQFAPYAVLGLAGGMLSDRHDRRRVLLVTQSSSMVLAAALAAVALLHVATVWEVDLIAALNGLVLVADTPARQAFTIEMVGRDELPNAVALNSSLFNASRILGPALGGVIIAGAGVGICFLLNALSYVAVITVLLRMDPQALHRGARAAQGVSMLRGIGEGLRYAWRTPQTRVVLLMMLFIGTISINFNVLLPVLTSNTLHEGPRVFGVLSACFGAGALTGALLSASLARASWRVLLCAAAGFGAAEALLAPQHGVVAAGAVLVLVGVAFSLYTSNSNATLQLTVPDALRGRVLALYAYVFFGTAPLGGLLAGWMSARGGTLLAFAVAGAVGMASAAGGALELRRVRATPATPRTQPALLATIAPRPKPLGP